MPAWLLTFFGSAKMGGVLVTVNTSYKVLSLTISSSSPILKLSCLLTDISARVT
ncbi:MAG: hypothetical protein IJF40_07955 [Clostridia bacterium]|nr:hypothetical protein [Clostridia bacterium]